MDPAEAVLQEKALKFMVRGCGRWRGWAPACVSVEGQPGGGARDGEGAVGEGRRGWEMGLGTAGKGTVGEAGHLQCAGPGGAGLAGGRPSCGRGRVLSGAWRPREVRGGGCLPGGGWAACRERGTPIRGKVSLCWRRGKGLQVPPGSGRS